MSDPNCADSRIYIGRLGYEVPLECVESWDISGDTASIKGALVASSVEEALVLRQQLNGYVGNQDEDVIPIVWNAHEAMNGFYRVRGGDVNFTGASLRHGVFEWSLDVERVAASSGPLFESVVTGAVRTNAHGFAGSLGWFGLPEAARGFGLGSMRVCETGEVFTSFASVARVNIQHGRALTEAARFWLPPGNYIDGAAQILTGDTQVPIIGTEAVISGYRTLVGQQIPNQPHNVVLSNGIVRFALSPQTFGIEAWHGVAKEWRGDTASRWKLFELLTDASGDTVSFGANPLSQVVVLRNTPEECAVRFVWNRVSQGSVGTLGRGGYVDVSLRRGARHVALHIASPTATEHVKIRRYLAENAVSVTGGIAAAAFDASGYKYILASPADITKETAGGAIVETTDMTRADYMVGFEIPNVGGSSGTGNTTAEVIKQYMAAQSERILVSGR